MQNTPLIRKAIGIDPLDVLQSGPYRQNKTSNQAGCQIDYMLQSRTQTLYICEFKFRQKELGVELIEAMKNKISALKIPRGYAAAPVLCHFGWISNQLRGSDYFYRIIDLADFLRTQEL